MYELNIDSSYIYPILLFRLFKNKNLILYICIPNRNYYQANKEKLKEQAKIRYSNKSKEKKEKSKE